MGPGKVSAGSLRRLATPIASVWGTAHAVGAQRGRCKCGPSVVRGSLSVALYALPQCITGLPAGAQKTGGPGNSSQNRLGGHSSERHLAKFSGFS